MEHSAPTESPAESPAKSLEKDAEKGPEKDRSEDASKARKPKKRRRWLRRIGYAFLVLILLLGGVRLYLPTLVRDYVNRTIDSSPLYDGKIGGIDIHLWRGAYSIREIRLVKTTGDVPVPLFSAPRVDLAIEWSALWNGKLVGRVLMDRPEINFVDGGEENKSGGGQTGGEGPWLQVLRDLFPFRINSVQVQDGSIHFRTFQGEKPVDVYLASLNASIDNLTNIRDETTPLVTTVKANALAMGQGKLEYQMKLNPFSYRPTFHMTLRLLSLDCTKLNDLARQYGGADFERGWLDLIIEVDSKEGLVDGYVKPLFRNLKIFSPTKDAKEDNPLQFFWEALLGAASDIFKNQPRDQLGTLIPFKGDASGTSPDIMATLGNALRNAFIRAYLPKLQRGASPPGMEFGPAQITDPTGSEG